MPFCSFFKKMRKDTSHKKGFTALLSHLSPFVDMLSMTIAIVA